MPIPAGNITTLNLDATSDSPATARADLLALTQQFNALIASANGVSGMATLDASGFLAGYGRLGAAQTWTGVNTFTSGVPLILSSASSIMQGRNTTLALPNGLWRLLFPHTDDFVYVHKNTAAAGDFSTAIAALRIGATQSIFSGTVTIANGVAAGEAVNKGQLDAATVSKIYGGRIINTGTVSVGYGPTGWTVTKSAVGVTVVTHNLGTTNYSAVVCPTPSASFASVVTHAANSFTVHTYNSAPIAVQDFDYSFVVAVN